jgi:hypothetical protein
LPMYAASTSVIANIKLFVFRRCFHLFLLGSVFSYTQSVSLVRNTRKDK